MTYEEARERLQRDGWLQPNGDIEDAAQYISCTRTLPGYCVLDGHFDLDQLEAVVVYLRHHERADG